jgi:amidase
VNAPADALHCFVPDSVELGPTGQGELSSLRVALKDMFDVAGRVSSFGHRRWRETHEPAATHAPVVAELLAHGATIAGLAKMDQLAYSLIGDAGEGTPPVNAFDPECFCGGSSSGSASAVAGGVVDVGIGTDTGGSVRTPAAACGLCSLRPTHGAVSTQGVLPLAPSLDVVGFLAREPDPLARTLRVLAPALGADVLARVLVPTDLGHALIRLGRTVADAAEAGVENVAVGSLVDARTGDLHARIQGREIWAHHGDWVTANLDHLATDVQTRLRRCEALSRDDRDAIDADLRARAAYAEDIVARLGADAVLALPVLPRRGPLRAWSDAELATFRTECFRLTAPSSLSGCPQAVVSVSLAGSPRSLGLLGPRGSDHALLELAGRVREAVGRA